VLVVRLEIVIEAALACTAAGDRNNTAARVAAFPLLDLDHLSAKIGEHLRRHRPLLPNRPVDNPNAIKWSAHAVSIPHPARNRRARDNSFIYHLSWPLSLLAAGRIYLKWPRFSQFLNFLYPPRCFACGARFPAADERRVCDECLARVERMPESQCEICGGPLESVVSGACRCARCAATRPHYGKARTIARYRTTAEDQPGTLPALIRRHKYGLDQSAGRALVEYLGDRLPVSSSDYDLIVPVPLHWRRLWWRGFNQAALLAEEVARRLRLPLDAVSFARQRSTSSQTARHHDERIRNVRRAFIVLHPERISGRRVLLIDDVMTTGATVNECARTLIAGGAASVDIFTLARVL